MVAFTCNLCGTFCEIETFRTEPASCPCGSNVRVRALIYLLSMELFGQSLELREFPKLKAIRGLGMTDKECYASLLADKFDYTNTFLDREPRFDFAARHPELSGMYDFILSADVLEHIAPPVERALEEVYRLLKPAGFLGATVYCNPTDQLREHFPDLYEYRVVPVGPATVLVNRRRDGTIEVHDNVILHGGSGETVEMREFGASALREKLLAAGFRQVHCRTEDIPELGILFDADVSQPLIARKQPFAMNAAAATQLVAQWRAAEGRSGALSAQLEASGEQVRQLARQLASSNERIDSLTGQIDLLNEQIRLARHSRWFRLGRSLGVGPASLARGVFKRPE